jgi:hypothetical protein
MQMEQQNLTEGELKTLKSLSHKASDRLAVVQKFIVYEYDWCNQLLRNGDTGTSHAVLHLVVQGTTAFVEELETLWRVNLSVDSHSPVYSELNLNKKLDDAVQSAVSFFKAAGQVVSNFVLVSQQSPSVCQLGDCWVADWY